MKILTFILLFATTINLANAAQIINFNADFKQFWSRAENKPFDEQQQYFSKYIESKDPSFYQNNVWNSKTNKDWKKGRDTVLAKLFKTYADVGMRQIDAAYDLYEKKTTEALALYRTEAPDFNSNILIMIAPGITWGGSYMPGEEHEYLGLGVDVYLTNKSLLVKPLAIHEMFHYYHMQLRLKKHADFVLSEEEYVKNGKLFWQLWDEGMAMWGTGFISGNYNPDYALMSTTSGKYDISPQQLSEYAQLFLEELALPAIDYENPVNVKKWFGVNVENNPLGENTPPMIGYYLGFLVIRGLQEKGISRQEFMGWNYAEAKPYIIKGLREML